MSTLPQTSGISPEYIDATLTELQVQYGMSNLAMLTPALKEIFSTAQNVRVVLLASDMLFFRMEHAFLLKEGRLPFPVGASAYYLQGRALAQGKPIDPKVIQEEAKSLDPKQFLTKPEELDEWMEDILKADEIVKRIKLNVESILEDSEINIVRFAGKYGDKVAIRLARFIDTYGRSEIMKRRAEAFALVSKIAWEDESVAALSVRTRITLAMSISHLCEIHKDDILGLGRQHISSEAFIESFRKRQIEEYKEGLKAQRISPSRLFPHMKSLTWQQAIFLFEDIFIAPQEAAENPRQGYLSTCARLRATITARASFGQSTDTRAAIAKAFFEDFSPARFSHIMENFGYRVTPAES